MSNESLYRVPIVDLRAQYDKIRDEVRRAVDEVAESQQFILGPAVKRFEEQFAAYVNCKHAVGVASGSDALLLALMALGVGSGDAVIVTPFTFFSTVSSITRLGATPMFVDIAPDTPLLSAQDVNHFLDQRAKSKGGRTIDSRTGLHIKAILPVHLFGQVNAMGGFLDLAKQYHLNVVEDVAQACGARLELNGKTNFAGAIGDLGCFSFFPSKTLGGFGDGGLVTTDDSTLAESLTMLRMHGESKKYYHDVTGINSRLDSLQAAILSVKQRYLEEWCEQRIQRANSYYELFSQTDLMVGGKVTVPPINKGKSHVFNNYVLGAERRDELKEFLAREEIQSEIYYPLPLHLQKCFAHLGYKPGDFPNSERAADRVLALPIYPEMTPAQQELVVEKIQAFYRR